MIIGTVTVLSILLFGGSGFSFEKYYKSFVEDVVEDKVRSEQILDLTKEADDQVSQYTKETKEVWAKDIKRTFQDFDSTEDDFRNIIATAEQSRFAVQKGLVDLRMGVKELMTEEEWNTMYERIREKEAEDRAEKEKKSKKG